MLSGLGWLVSPSGRCGACAAAVQSDRVERAGTARSRCTWPDTACSPTCRFPSSITASASMCRCTATTANCSSALTACPDLLPDVQQLAGYVSERVRAAGWPPSAAPAGSPPDPDRPRPPQRKADRELPLKHGPEVSATAAARRPLQFVGRDLPRALLSMLEIRAPLEFGVLLATLPTLRHAPHGDGHPVLLLPGFGAGDLEPRAVAAVPQDPRLRGRDLGTRQEHRLQPPVLQGHRAEDPLHAPQGGRKVSLSAGAWAACSPSTPPMSRRSASARPSRSAVRCA